MQVNDPISELHSTKLYQVLASCDSEYAERITRFVREVAPLLATTERHFPYFTRHDAHHGYRVVLRIEQVVDPTCIDVESTFHLAPAEIFLLIAAAYAHDLGMTVFPDEVGKLLNELQLEPSPGWETHPTLQRHLRHEHSKRGGQYILENADRLGVPLNLVNALDTMMQAHNFSFVELDALTAVHAAKERQLDVRQLAAIVCVGDALEFSDTRVMEGVLERINIDPRDSARTSYLENMKHVCVGDSLAIDEHGRVVVSGTFTEADVLALAHRTFDEMEGWIQGYCDIDRRSRVHRLKIRPEQFSRNLTFTGGRFERLGVRLNKRSVIDLIASNAVWRTQTGIAIRELLQNAVEACRYRDHHSGAVDRYVPTVRVEFDREKRTISVTDNGCGMTERTVLNNFLTVGSSRSKEAGYAEADYAPIARFGVGFWSVFMIAEEARIETAAFEPYRGLPALAKQAAGFAFDVSLRELKDYTVFLPIKRECGTRIVLKIRKEIVFDDVLATGRRMLLCSSVPVKFFIDDQEIQVPPEVPDVSGVDVFGSRNRQMDELGIRVFQWRGVLDHTELSLALAYRLVDGKASFLADSGSSLLTVLPGIHTPRTAVCGFTVPVRPDALCIDFFRVGSFFANYRIPKGFEFSLDRQQLLPNAASEKFAEDIAALVHAGYREFLAKTNSLDVETIATLYDQAQMHGGNVYDTFTDMELSLASVDHPDLLGFRLFPVTSEGEVDQIAPIHVDLTGLQKLVGTIFFLQKRADKRINASTFLPLNPEDRFALGVVLAAAQDWVRSGAVASPVYVMEANRLGSMLFDADPESSVRFVGLEHFGNLCIQAVSLERTVFNGAPRNILAQIQGKWTGTVYLRSFQTPDRKPYLFMGRHRVLIEKSSNLAKHLQDLISADRRTQCVEIITLLQEDEAGYSPEEIQHLL